MKIPKDGLRPSWTVAIRAQPERHCGPGIWITDEQGRTVVDTGNMRAWPLGDRHRAMIENIPNMVANLQSMLADLEDAARQGYGPTTGLDGVRATLDAIGLREALR